MAGFKHKRQSMDSAIADMSSENSFATEIVTQMSDEEDATFSQQKRRKSSYSSTPAIFDTGNYGTAASQRPRRAASRLSANTPDSRRSVTRPDPPRPQEKNHIAAAQSQNMSTSETLQISKETIPPMRALEVKGSVESEQTPERDQATTALLTPPQTLEKKDSQASTQSPHRKSTRNRRPPARFQQSIEEATPCRKRPKRSTVRGENAQETNTLTGERNSYIVRLRMPSAFVDRGPGQSMFFTESFSHRQKGSDSQESLALPIQNPSFTGNGSFQDPDSGPFAQPHSEPIPIDSQDLHSSQSAPDNDATSHAAVHLQEHLQIGGSSARERFSTSGWIVNQEQRVSAAALPQQHNSPPKTVGNNESWQTQPTLPLFPQPSSHSDTRLTVSANVSFQASDTSTIDENTLDLLRADQALDKQKLYEAANQLIASRAYGSRKPEPVGQPSVWADGRMELCETLHYFRSYQGACHSTGGFVRGFMFDKVAHPRDWTDTNVIIARAGGGQVRDKESGEMKASGDQVEGIVSQNLRNCMNHYNPVVIITGADNPHMPSQPPHQYCVLDYFKPTHIWTEKSGNSKIVRYRFEKLNARKDSWWRAKGVDDPIPLGSLLPPFSKACGTRPAARFGSSFRLATIQALNLTSPTKHPSSTTRASSSPTTLGPTTTTPTR
ncbi:hypothetical protein OPT61_g9564 [Boeremia exigua]|uniref:Uncharacterized protein n=1 Tax=Boeremia exigua TaxID=749465 RepID=A0ACC2HV38_9PLEO|nr:hypothetical protein OPT61_g9564 [Boeremia exigua]